MREDPGFFDDYFAGVYDRECSHCNGEGKIKVDSKHMLYDAGNEEDYDGNGDLKVCACEKCLDDRRSERMAELRMRWAEEGCPEGSFSAWLGE
jgi:hypothetical protein